MRYVFIAFFSCWNKKLDCRQLKAEIRTNLLQKLTFNPPAHFVQLDKFGLYCTNVKVIGIRILLYLGGIRKILHSPYWIYFKCRKFNKIFRIYNFFFIVLAKHKGLYEQDFLEYAFQIRTWKHSIGSFIKRVEMYVLSA